MKILHEKHTMIFCMLLILLDFMGLTITIVTFPALLLSSHSIFHQLPAEFTLKFTVLGVALALYPLGQFFGASALGKLSDHWGRKNILMIALLGTFFGFLMSAISITYGFFLLLLISRFITGLFAGNVAIAQAVIVDTH